LKSLKSWYPHYFNTQQNLEYVGPIPDIEYYGVSEMSESERTDFLDWNEGEKAKFFYKKRVLETYCQDGFTVLRHAPDIQAKFKAISNIDYFSSPWLLQLCAIKFSVSGF
jgi:hypothetical protein